MRKLISSIGTVAVAVAMPLVAAGPAAAYDKYESIPGAVRLDVPYDSTPHVIDVAGSSDRSKVQLWTLTSGRRQNVRAIRYSTLANGNPVVYFQETTSGKCLDESRDKPPANGTVVYLYTCTRASNQLWELREEALGFTYEVVSRYDGRCLDAKDKSYANGTQIQVWSCGGAWNQYWMTYIY